MAKKQFKAESKRLLDMMIHSIYTQREIFLRELISNASDAVDKIYYRALKDSNLTFNKDDYFIQIAPNKEERTLTISDTGIGMTKQELEDNLGTIAQSGSLSFKKDQAEEDAPSLIGQFGVGFYSAFMVADKVTVTSKSLDEEQAYCWESTGTEGYTLEKSDKEAAGTEIVLHIKANTEEDNYDQFLDTQSLRSIIKKYSDFIRYPIKMWVTSQRPIEEKEQQGDESKSDEPKYEEFSEEQVINSMVPIWRKNKKELTAQDYENFYNEKHYGWDKPLKHLHLSVDGAVRYQAILYIPETTPFDYYTREFEKGLELYSNSVLIMEKCPELIPDYFSFVKGMVDSEDLSLNISREMLQQDRQLKQIAKNIQNKIRSQLLSLLKDERESYEKFYSNFGRQLKFGVYNDYGMNKEVLQDLLLFYSSKEKKLSTLDEYVSRMKEEQKYIYYATGETNERIAKLPQTELVADKDYEILYLTDDIDEFVVKVLAQYKEKTFKSVSSSELGIENEDGEKSEEQTNENKELFDQMKEILGEKVHHVQASKRLKSYPVCFSTKGDLTIEMEKVLNSMPSNQHVKAEKVLEINMNHSVFTALKSTYEDKNKDKLALYTNLLYNQAQLIEGLPINDPVEFTNDMWKLMI